MMPDRIHLGAPQHTLYDLYTKMLEDPSQLESNPAYKFLFGQGQKALNASLAAKRLRFSGKSLADTTAFGEGMAADYAGKMLPQYQAGAREELQRFMGPAGLLPSYANVNARATQSAESSRAAADMIPWMQQMLSGGGGEMAPSYGAPVPTGPRFGGVGGAYDYTPQVQPFQTLSNAGWDQDDPMNQDYFDWATA